MINRTATATEVRKSYKDAGHTVRIDREGHVEFKRDGEGPWLEGRWVSEYRVHAEAGVYLT
jgi:hypothetical protein